MPLTIQSSPTLLGVTSRQNRDCSILSLATALGRDYEDIASILRRLGKRDNCGLQVKMLKPLLDRLGFAFSECGSMRTWEFVHRFSVGTYLVWVSGHFFTVHDGIVLDSHNHSPNAIVKAFWTKLS